MIFFFIPVSIQTNIMMIFHNTTSTATTSFSLNVQPGCGVRSYTNCNLPPRTSVLRLWSTRFVLSPFWSRFPMVTLHDQRRICDENGCFQLPSSFLRGFLWFSANGVRQNTSYVARTTDSSSGANVIRNYEWTS